MRAVCIAPLVVGKALEDCGGIDARTTLTTMSLVDAFRILIEACSPTGVMSAIEGVLPFSEVEEVEDEMCMEAPPDAEAGHAMWPNKENRGGRLKCFIPI